MEEKQWFLYVVDHHEGPFSADEIKKLVKNGGATFSSYVWKDGLTDWTVMSEVPEFGDGIPKKQIVPPENLIPEFKSKEVVSKEPESPVQTPMGTGAQVISAKINIDEDVFKSKAKKDKKPMFAFATQEKSKSRFLKYFILLLIIGAVVYQETATQKLDPLLTKVGMQAKVKAWNLRPLPIPDFSPFMQKLVPMMPASLQAYFSSVKLPEGVPAVKKKMLQEIASFPLKQGARVSTALLADDEVNPSFVVVSNLPDGTQFEIFLLGKEGTLLSGTGFEDHSSMQIKEHIGRTNRHYFESTKPLPKGSYLLVVYESDRQSSEVSAVFTSLPKKETPHFIPAGKVAFAMDFYFLGGLQDQMYAERLKEVTQRVQMRKTQELTDLGQMATTLEGMANESASKFFILTKKKLGVKQKKDWQNYHSQYTKMSEQLKEVLTKAQTDIERKEYLWPTLFEKVRQTYVLSENLHLAETDFVQKPGSVTMDLIRTQATQVATALIDLKNTLAEAKH